MLAIDFLNVLKYQTQFNKSHELCSPTITFTSASKLLIEFRPGFVVCCAVILSLSPFSLIFFFSSDFRTTLRTCMMSYFSTVLPSKVTLIFHIHDTALAFMHWSPKNGPQINGTPLEILSKIEFHPQCVKNAPTAKCPNTYYK